MAFSFASSFNTQRVFDIDTSDFDYCSLEELFEENKVTKDIVDDAGNQTGETEEVCEKIFQIHGIYINDKSMFEPQPIVALDDRYVNLPAHIYKTACDILANPKAINSIKAGKVGFTIDKYYQKKYKKDCYTINWVDM